MNPSDIYAVLQWWFVLLLIGIGFLPLTTRLFRNFFDKGYIFSKPIGLAVTSYLVFLFGVSHVLPFSIFSCYISLVLLVIGLGVLLPQKWQFIYMLKHSWKTFIAEEFLFLAALLTWAYVHSFSPDIHGLEKYMDFGFINSILRSKYFPPLDMWFTPLPINYYYFGHFMTAVLTKMSTLPSNITFNLMMATIFALCFSQTFSLGANLYTFLKRNSGKVSSFKKIVVGCLTACLVTLGGNLHIIYGFFSAYNTENPVPPWKLKFEPLTFPNSYWYPDATRFIYHTIHEFPIYSWTVADLHGHVLDIPFVLSMIAFLLALFMRYDPKDSSETSSDDERDQRIVRFAFLKKVSGIVSFFTMHPLILIFIGFMIGIMYMTNAWDGAIYLLLTGLVFIAIYVQKIPNYKASYEKSEAVQVIKNVKSAGKHATLFPRWLFLLGADVALSLLVVVSAFFLFTTPYSIFFNVSSLAHGIGVICAPGFLIKIGRIGPFLFEPDHCQHSYWWELLILYGFFYFFVVTFLVFVLRARKLFHVDTFIMLLIILATLLILIPELFYVKDIYPTYYRANTMFKLVFQAFIMLMLSSGYIIVRLLSPSGAETNFQTGKFYRYIIFLPITVVLLSLVFTYPYLAITSYYGNFKTYHGLNGTAYLQTLYPSDYAAIQWLNSRIKGQPVILEAQGDSYTDYARVSANTGLPTVLGWTVHEWLWRGDYSIPAPRIADVQTMYQSTDVQQTKALLQKYHVHYVFIGTLEHQKYPTLDEAKFNQLGKVVYANGITKIYKLSS